jgi:hypothetical protein
MGDRTHGGKGDRNRSNNTTFRNGWDAIFGNKDTISDREYKVMEEEKAQILDEIGAGPHEFSPPLTQVQIDRKLREWGMMYDCLQNMHIYEYPVEEVKELLKQIKTS